jgi:hypothetical protein
MVATLPEQTAVDEGVMLIIGFEFTVTGNVAEVLAPQEFPAITDTISAPPVVQFIVAAVELPPPVIMPPPPLTDQV